MSVALRGKAVCLPPCCCLFPRILAPQTMTFLVAPTPVVVFLALWDAGRLELLALFKSVAHTSENWQIYLEKKQWTLSVLPWSDRDPWSWIPGLLTKAFSYQFLVFYASCSQGWNWSDKSYSILKWKSQLLVFWNLYSTYIPSSQKSIWGSLQ